MGTRPLHFLNPARNGTTACGKRSVRVSWTQYRVEFMNAAHRCPACRAFVRGQDSAVSAREEDGA